MRISRPIRAILNAIWPRWRGLKRRSRLGADGRGDVSGRLLDADRSRRPGQCRAGRRVPTAFLRRRRDRRRQAVPAGRRPISRCSARRIISSSRSSRGWRATSTFRCSVVGVPTVREKDGLAMSSRNVYLSPTERQDRAALASGAEGAARPRMKSGKPLRDVLAVGRGQDRAGRICARLSRGAACRNAGADRHRVKGRSGAAAGGGARSETPG